jgi:uncharacterized membrane protein YqiK
MGRQRVNPFDQGSAERVLFDRYRKATAEAEKHEREAAIAMTAAKAQRSAADRYAEALRALGHGDKVTPLKALPNYAKLGEGEEEYVDDN